MQRMQHDAQHARIFVHRHQVFLAIAVQIRRHDHRRAASRAVERFGGECQVTLVDEHRDVAGGEVRRRNVQAAIVIEIAEHHRVGVRVRQ